MSDKSELLAPAGSYEVMKACYSAGADAVYMGLSKFSARAYADNASSENYVDAIDYAHVHGKKLYCTVNTLFKENELFGELYDTLKPLYEAGLDAVIVQDLGAMRFIHENFPDLPIHASTQATVTGSQAVDFLRPLGVKRIVPARELNLKEIETIIRETGAEMECFIHGALCYSYSGQCLFSSIAGGRSGNRGRCAQPCRMAYDLKTPEGKYVSKRGENYLISLKDLNTLEILPEILKAGVYSLKIEGRMKKAEYAAGVTSIYRKYLDRIMNGKKYAVDPTDERRLFDLFNRQGFTDGYYRRQNGREMLTLKEADFRESDDAFRSEIRRLYIEKEHKTALKGVYSFAENKRYRLDVSCDIDGRHEAITVYSDTEALHADRRAASAEDVEKQLKKLGDTDFFWEKLEGTIDGELFLPVSALNDFRRKAVSLLREKILTHYRRKAAPAVRFCREKEDEKGGKPILSVLVRNIGQYRAASAENVGCVILESTVSPAEEYASLVKRLHDRGKTVFLAFPQIFRDKAVRYWENHTDDLKKAGFDGFLIRSLEEKGFLRKYEIGGMTVSDHNLYAFNTLSKKELLSAGFDRVTVPVELNGHEIENTGFCGQEMIVYGRLPMMVSANCLHRTTEGCDHRETERILIDRMKNEMPVFNECRYCLNTIYNSKPLNLLDVREQVMKLGLSVLRLEFTDESEALSAEVIRTFSDAFIKGKDIVPLTGDYTRGHYKRGVE